MNDNGYYIVKKLYLANALSFLGFRYFKFNDKDTGDLVYSFHDTNKFRIALNGLLELKNKIN